MMPHLLCLCRRRWVRLAGTALILISLLAAASSGTLGAASVPAQDVAIATPHGQRSRLDDLADHASRVWRDVTYCTMDGVALTMDVYAPRNANRGQRLLSSTCTVEPGCSATSRREPARS
ncbi:MAG: hypothetical protein KatS3mg059_0708 [Thermomicrobiales bacterium]|nr:MAG: hypothetical protein KatS3mg059_0708 [Thermomicrobiales bacterium]